MIHPIQHILKIILKEKNLKSFLRLFLILLCIIFSKLCLVSFPILYGKIIDSISYNSSELIIIFLVGGYGITYFLSSGFGYIQETILARLTHRISRQICVNVLKHIHGLSHDFHLSTNSGNISTSIQLGIRGVESIISSVFFGFIPIVIQLIFIASIVFLEFNALVLFFLLLLLTAYFSSVLYVTKRHLLTIRQLNSAETSINSTIIEGLTNFESIKFFNKKDEEINIVNKKWKNQENLAVKASLQLLWLRLIEKGIMTVTLIMFVGYSLYQARRGEITVGHFVMLITYLMQLFDPLETLAYEQDHIRHALVDVEAMFNLLKLSPSVMDTSHGVHLKTLKGEISFRGVSFGYDPKKLILKDFFLTIPARKTVAIVGKSGSGKTTLLRLIVRFYDIFQGSIQIDDQDIRGVTKKSLRNMIAVVPQDITLFNDTICFNIAYSKPDATFQEVKKIAKIVHLHDFVSHLPEGYNTVVGERGLKLSGGERQRIALARALIKNPKILIFDEATSFLDSQTEKVIQENILRLNHTCTIIVIAHRLNSVINADKIIVLDKGKIVEEGNHSDLLKKKGAYFTLWEAHKGHYTA